MTEVQTPISPLDRLQATDDDPIKKFASPNFSNIFSKRNEHTLRTYKHETAAKVKKNLDL